jgi:hypothetical protein
MLAWMRSRSVDGGEDPQVRRYRPLSALSRAELKPILAAKAHSIIAVDFFHVDTVCLSVPRIVSSVLTLSLPKLVRPGEWACGR